MRKWNYFLTLLVGATLTLTSCIDTTEPAGIEAMRTSKSEWLKAKAAYENALVQLKLVEVEKEKVAVEVAKIGLELEKLNLKKQAVLDSLEIVKAISDNEEALAQNALDIARLEQELANLADEQEAYELNREEQLLNLYHQIALAEQNYLQTVTDLKLAMLTYKDEQMRNKLENYENQLNAYNTNLSAARADLANYQLQKWSFEADKAMFVKGLPVEKAKKEKDIALQKSLIAKLDSLNKIDAEDITALHAQSAAYQEELDALVEKETEMKKEIAAMKVLSPEVAEEIAALNVEITKLAEEYAEINEKKKEDYTLTIAKDDVNEAMVNTLASVLSSYTDAFEAAFEQNEDYTYNMIADFVLEDEIQKVVYKEDDGKYGHYNDIISQIKYEYQNEYANAYTSVVTDDWNASSYNMFDEDGNVKDIYLARLEAAQDRNSKDEAELSKAEKEYNETVEKWGKAYDAYLAAAAKFQGYTNDTPEFDAVWEAVEEYQKAKNDTLNYTDDDVKAGIPANTLYKKIANFINIKNAVDGLYYGDFVEYYDSVYVAGVKAEEQDEVRLAEFNALVLSWTDEYAFEAFVGGKLPSYELGRGYDFNQVEDAAENGGTLAQFLVASEELFGNQWFSVTGDIILPIKDGDKYVVSENVPSWVVSGVYAAYVDAVDKAENAEKYEAILNSVEKWVALVDKLEAQNEACVKVWDAINDELQANLDKDQEIDDKITELQTLNLDEEAIWAKEFECYKINGNWDVVAFSSNNPYYTGLSSYVETEKSVIDDAKKLVDDAIRDAGAGFSYYYFDPVAKNMNYVSKSSLDNMISSAENTLATYENDLEKINTVIAAVEKYDAKAGTWNDFFNNNVDLLYDIDANIANCEADIVLYESRIEAVKAAIAALIAAYEAGELDVEFPGEGA